MRNNQWGFIQIPLLLLIVFGALIATGGSYYAVKHKPQPVKQNTVVEEKSKIATTSAETATSTTTSQPSADNPFLNALNKTSDKTPPPDNPYINALKSSNTSAQPKEPERKSLNLLDHPITVPNNVEQPARQEPVIQKEDDSEKRFQDFTIKGKQLLTLFEQDEKNFKLLADAITQHKKQSAEHATQMMDAWITLIDQNISSVSSQYSGMLNSTKNYLTYDKDYLVNYSNSLYDIVFDGGYLLSQIEADPLKFVKSKLEKCLGMSAEEWTTLNGQSCTISFFELKPDYSKRLTDGANKLAEIDHIVLEAIGSHARSAEDDVRGDMDLIARYTQLDASVQASFNNINNQLQQRQVQLQTINTPIQCYTRTNDSIFDKNRTYSTTCQSDTRTPQQICDEKIAAWVGSGAYTSKPSCE